MGMGNVNKDHEVAKNRKDSGIWSYISRKIGDAVYSAALKTPYQTKYDIVFGSNDGITGTLGIDGSAKRDLRNELLSRNKNAKNYWSRELEAGKISKADFDIEIDNIAKTIESRYERRLKKFENEILPVAFNSFLEGIPENDVKEAIPVSYTAEVPSGLATALLGRAASILMAETPANRSMRRNSVNTSEPGYFEKEFYKIADKVFKYPMKAIVSLADLMIEHPRVVIAATATGIGMGGYYKYNTDKNFQKWVDDGVSKAKTGVFGISAYFSDFFKSAPVIDKAVPANESVVATPQVTETPLPNYDYYDEECGCGIKYIEPSIKDNVTKMLKTMKEVTPNRYKEVIPYAPKKIVRSTGNYNYYARAIPPTKYLPGSDDEIGLSRVTEVAGGSDNKISVIDATSRLYAEIKGAKTVKTNVTFNNRYDREMFQNQGVADFNVEAGIWTQKQANAYLSEISEELKSGEYDKKYN